jgi:flavin-dependent dehydrogenase
LVEPVTGEGIAFAMQSGSLAAEAIGEAVAAESPEKALAFYQVGYAPIARAFRWAGALRYLLFPMASQQLVSWVLPRTGTIPERYLDLMADEISYPEFARCLARRACRAPLKLLSGVKGTGSHAKI